MVARFQTLFSIVNFAWTDYADTQSTEPERGPDRCRAFKFAGKNAGN